MEARGTLRERVVDEIEIEIRNWEILQDLEADGNPMRLWVAKHVTYMQLDHKF